ncbi:MAG: ATP-binding protein [Chloroflexi bacterium]|nr:ATP-binding protein [Chloroflexota bacterium]
MFTPVSCGNFGNTQKNCTCAPAVLTKYQKRISGPILDRNDIHIEFPSLDYEMLSSDRLGESSAEIRQRVENARQVQRERFVESSSIACNADMRIAGIRKSYKLDKTSQSPMRSAMNQINLSARAYHRLLKLARMIADLAESNSIQKVHIAETLQYRPKIMLG